MIKDPLGIIAVLLVIEGLVIHAAEMPRLRWFFKYVPFMFLIYLLPMVVGTIGLIPPECNAADKVITPVYGAIVKYCLPACLILLLINVDLRAIHHGVGQVRIERRGHVCDDLAHSVIGHGPKQVKMLS